MDSEDEMWSDYTGSEYDDVPALLYSSSDEENSSDQEEDFLFSHEGMSMELLHYMILEMRRLRSRRPSSRQVGKCKFYMMGRCKEGDFCSFSHDFEVKPEVKTELVDGCTTVTQRAVSQTPCKFFLQNQCLKGDLCNFSHVQPPKRDSSTLSCSICLDIIEQCGKKYGLLNGCNHVFCLECIRQESHYVVPSDYFPKDVAERDDILMSYTQSLATVTCKYYSQFKDCPFGDNCFYAHK
ncbi:hypothetical protein PROFUN_04847 [Planoprotostelium fungivorum]|uniref:RING-type E3 ubiquitin transferase n=1 Tax=Planoprotostelium fungivorum TaxID=1890364 RepID=A0A2P6NF29_9EUKA|nr:hypothetical protein PROFUN_12504 [Planoprotostelium fungivorum]PRP82542.1 hypothetical protein PROFUN_04847 [Planoprotostelium fungivorum]